MAFLAALLGLLVALLLAPSAQAAWTWPLHGELIGTYRNGDDPYAGGQHRGIDIAGPVGARVVAATGGEVRFAGTAGSSGLTVAVRTADGFDTSYLHLSTVAVREGDGVDAGDIVGAVGTSGRRSSPQPHLHFGVREAGTRHAYRNPLDFLPARPAPPPGRAPDPSPAPLPVPAPRSPAPAPAAGRSPAPTPAPRELPRRVPRAVRWPRRVPADERAPRRVPAAGRAPRGAPSPAHDPAPAPATRSVPEPGRQPAARPTPSPGPRPQPSRSPASSIPQPALGPAGGTEATAPGARADRAATPGASAEPSHSGGPDIGWMLACAGLLLAAALLGTTEDGRRAAGSGKRGLVRLLRPLMGRS